MKTWQEMTPEEIHAEWDRFYGRWALMCLAVLLIGFAVVFCITR